MKQIALLGTENDQSQENLSMLKKKKKKKDQQQYFKKPQKEMVVKKHFTNKGDSDPSL